MHSSYENSTEFLVGICQLRSDKDGYNMLQKLLALQKKKRIRLLIGFLDLMNKVIQVHNAYV